VRVAAFLRANVEARPSIVFAGHPGVGTTTLLPQDGCGEGPGRMTTGTGCEAADVRPQGVRRPSLHVRHLPFAGRQLGRRAILQAAGFGAVLDMARAVVALDAGAPHGRERWPPCASPEPISRTPCRRRPTGQGATPPSVVACA
jgi:hypothetical protein